MAIDEETLRQMQGLARTIYTLRPELLNGDATMGELPWVWGMGHAVHQHTWRHRLWFEGDAAEPIGWAWAHLPRESVLTDGSTRRSEGADLAWLTHPDHPDIFDEILDWFDEQAVGLERTITPHAEDTEALERLAAHGYEVDEHQASDKGHWIQFNARDLEQIEEPKLPDGYVLRTAAEVGTEAAWRAHMGAWHPSTLSLEAMGDVQQTESYRADLHMVVVTEDGTPVASATIWLDEATGAAEFEPVGTHPDHRRKGVARAMLLHGMHTAKASGASRMLVACLGAPAYPAARELYYSVGFKPIRRDVPHVKQA